MERIRSVTKDAEDTTILSLSLADMSRIACRARLVYQLDRHRPASGWKVTGCILMALGRLNAVLEAEQNQVIEGGPKISALRLAHGFSHCDTGTPFL